MKKKRILLLIIVSLFIFTACNSKKENSNGENNKGQSEKIEYNEENNTSYVLTLDSYISTIRNVINEGYHDLFDTSVLYLFPVGKGSFSEEKVLYSPYSEEWKYVFVGATYDGAGYMYYIFALDKENYGTDFKSSNMLEIETIEKLDEVEEYTKIYSLTSDTEYTKDTMNEDLLKLVNIVKKDKIKIIVK